MAKAIVIIRRIGWRDNANDITLQFSIWRTQLLTQGKRTSVKNLTAMNCEKLGNLKDSVSVSWGISSSAAWRNSLQPLPAARLLLSLILHKQEQYGYWNVHGKNQHPGIEKHAVCIIGCQSQTRPWISLNKIAMDFVFPPRRTLLLFI